MPYRVTSPLGVALDNLGVSFPSTSVGWVAGGVPCTSPTQCPGYIQHTTDGGHTWAFAPTPANLPYMGAITCPTNIQCLAVGETLRGAVSYRTTDGGATWASASLPDMENAFGVSCPDNLTCFAVGQMAQQYTSTGGFITSNASVARSTDGGLTWTHQPVTGGLAYLQSVSCPITAACMSAGATIRGGAVAITTNAGTPAPPGYRMVASDGGIFTFGDAHFYGSTGNVALHKPIVGMAATPDGGGYWLVASDGGIFTFGDAHFYGSTGNVALHKPIVGLAATGDGGGYWLVASDGGIFTFGDAQYFGSTGNVALYKPIVGMTLDPVTGGYWLVASDGGVFSFDAPFLGSTGTVRLNKPILGIDYEQAG
jgi:hypothetical protein